MSSNVFANGNEISAKKDSNKSICAMPDVCLTPPSPPAGPLPIPYPNSSAASKTTNGSKSVKVGGSEVGLKNKSTYKNSNGDEAATKSQGMGVISHNIQGPLKHTAWSMDVHIEGKNAIRHLDMTTQNHGTPTNVPGIDLAKLAPPTGDPECVELEMAAREDMENDFGGELPPNAAHVRGVDSNGNHFKAVQGSSTDAIASAADSGYSPPHGETNHPCNGKPYNPNSQGNRDHAECKMIQEAIGGIPPGGSITMRINWNNEGALSNNPCDQCKGSICETAQQCAIDIYICKENEDGDLEAKKVPCTTTVHKPGGKAWEESTKGHTHKWQSSLGW